MRREHDLRPKGTDTPAAWYRLHLFNLSKVVGGGGPDQCPDRQKQHGLSRQCAPCHSGRLAVTLPQPLPLYSERENRLCSVKLFIAGDSS